LSQDLSAGLIIVLAVMLRVLTVPVKVAGLGEGDDGRHGMLLSVCRDRAHRGLDGDLLARGDRRRSHQASSARCWPDGFRGLREEWARRVPALLVRGVVGHEKKVDRTPFRHRRSRRQPASGQINRLEDA
jgi:hypothetical protein